MCDECRSEMLDPTVAVAQVRALREILRESSSSMTPRVREDLARVAWPEVWTRAEDGSKVALVAGEPVKFGGGDAAIVFHDGQVTNVRVLPTRRLPDAG